MINQGPIVNWIALTIVFLEGFIVAALYLLLESLIHV
jgi:hypothetical protein